MNTDRITANFAYHEFERSAKAEQNGLDNTIASSFDPDQVRDDIRALVENVLQPIRDAVAEPVSISSGYRSPEVNRLAGGSATSHHKSGKAKDYEPHRHLQIPPPNRNGHLPHGRCFLELPATRPGTTHGQRKHHQSRHRLHPRHIPHPSARTGSKTDNRHPSTDNHADRHPHHPRHLVSIIAERATHLFR